jgi:hypothetical protein
VKRKSILQSESILELNLKTVGLTQQCRLVFCTCPCPHKKRYVNVCRSSGPIVALKNLRTVAYWHVLCPKMNRLRLCGQTASRGYIIVGLPKPCAASFSGLLIDSQVCIGHLLTHPSSVTDLTSAGP